MSTQTMTTPITRRPAWLPYVLRANALFCAACGVAALLGGAGLAAWMGLPALWLQLPGAGLILYALFPWRVGGSLDPAQIRTVTLLDVAWIAGSAAILLFPLLPLTGAGEIVVLVVALVTVDFALAQYVGLRKL